MNQMNSQNRYLVAAAVLAMLSVSLGLVGCEARTDGKEAGPAKGKRVPTVAVEVVRREPMSRLLELTGETAAVESVVIAATVEGPISYCPWREGDRVDGGVPGVGAEGGPPDERGIARRDAEVRRR